MIIVCSSCGTRCCSGNFYQSPEVTVESAPAVTVTMHREWPLGERDASLLQVLQRHNSSSQSGTVYCIVWPACSRSLSGRLPILWSIPCSSLNGQDSIFTSAFTLCFTGQLCLRQLSRMSHLLSALRTTWRKTLRDLKVPLAIGF